MRLSEIKLSEAPLADISYHPTDNPGGFSAHEVALIKKYKANGTYNEKLKGVPFDLYVYIIDDDDISNPGMYYPEGIISPRIWKTRTQKVYSTKTLASSMANVDMGHEAFQSIFAVVRERMEKNPSSVHFIMGDNFSDSDRMAPTPWIIAHRLAHAGASKLLDIPKSLYNTVRFRSRIHSALFASLPMASARHGKLDDPGEMITEIAAQLFIKGDIKIDEDKMTDMLIDHAEPEQIRKAIAIWKITIANAVKRFPTWASKFEGRVFYI